MSTIIKNAITTLTDYDGIDTIINALKDRKKILGAQKRALAKAEKTTEKDSEREAKKVKTDSKKTKMVDQYFNPNEDGVSEWVSREELQLTPLGWGNNGVFRHGVFQGDTRYIWEKYPLKGPIQKIKTTGFSSDYLYGHKRPIRDDIHKHHKSMGCVVCGSKSALVTDHKNDLYNDPRVLNNNTQTIDDFQCLCNHCNLQKRQISKMTLEENKRIGATTIPSLAIFGIDFIEGDETIDITDINAMKGTYWYDPIAFMNYIKINIIANKMI